MKETWQRFILSSAVLILCYIMIARLSKEKHFDREHFCPFIHGEFENESTVILTEKERNIEGLNPSQNTSEHVNCNNMSDLPIELKLL